MDDQEVACSECGGMVSPLALFPGGICVECYAKTPEANAPLGDGSEVVAAFGNSVTL